MSAQQNRPGGASAMLPMLRADTGSAPKASEKYAGLPDDWRARLPDPAYYYGGHVDEVTWSDFTGWAQSRCPFHDDKLASLSVQLGGRGDWRCSEGCGTGDMIDFHRRTTGLTFVNAVRDLLGLSTSHTVASEKHEGRSRAGRTNTTDLLVGMVRRHAELFHSPAGDAYATIKSTTGDAEVAQTWSLASSGFVEWMGACAWKELRLAISDATRGAAIATLSGIAKFDGNESQVFLRCAPSVDGTGTVLDLTNERWQAVEITAAGWHVIEQANVRFWRPRNAQPLPVPERGGEISELWRFANVREEDRPLVLAWLLESLRPGTDFPILELVAEQGTAKSVTQTVLRKLIDPSEVPLRAAPKSVEDVFIAARNAWLVSFNNISRLAPQQQDALCSLATPGGYASRTLYTNAEETAWNTQRPVVINGISTLATAADLADRTIHIEPPKLTEYRKASTLWAEFDEVQPRVLGALLDLFVATLLKLPGVHIEKPPRLADFAHLGEAMMQAQGTEPGAFMALYNANREHAALRSLDASPVGQAVMAMLDRHVSWEGTYKELLDALLSHRPDVETWPKSARGLADALRRAAPALRLAGYLVDEDEIRRTDGYHVALSKRANTAAAQNTSSS